MLRRRGECHFQFSFPPPFPPSSPHSLADCSGVVIGLLRCFPFLTPFPPFPSIYVSNVYHPFSVDPVWIGRSSSSSVLVMHEVGGRTARFFLGQPLSKWFVRTDRASESGTGKRTFECSLSKFYRWSCEKSPKNCQNSPFWPLLPTRILLCFELEQI